MILLLTCRYSGEPKDYDKAYEGAKTAMLQKFFGPPDKGVFSPSVQFTLFEMGKAAIQA